MYGESEYLEPQRPFPTEFVMPLTDSKGRVLSTPGARAGAVNPVFGTVNGQYVRFFMFQVYNEQRSLADGVERMDDIEMVEIINDKLNKCHLRVSEMNRRQREQYAQIYASFKEQKQIEGTLIENWKAVGEYQRSLLIASNVMAVEQLAAMDDGSTNRLGPDGIDLRDKARRHVAGKKELDKSAERQKELEMMRLELEKQSEDKMKKQEAYFERKLAEMQTEFSKKLAGNIEKKKPAPKKKEKIVEATTQA